MTKCRNVLIAVLAGGVTLIRSASALWGLSPRRTGGRGLATLVAAAGLLVTLAVGPASATPPDACQRNLSAKAKGSEIKNLTVCWWTKSNGKLDFTYTGTIKDTAKDSARARVIARSNFSGDPKVQSGTVLMEASGKGKKRNFGRAAGGGAIRGINNFNLRLQTYDKSEGKVKDSSFWMTFP
jgi:hypothetical protein